jgi:lipopolysaccharide biosynthesis regulator YciM
MQDQNLEEITGYLELGLWQEANDLIEDLPPDAKTSPAVLSLRVSIYQAASSWELMTEVACHLVTIEPDYPLHWLNYAQAALYAEGLPLFP